MSNATQPQTPKRRWYQYSLRALLLTMLLFSLTVGWIGSKLHRARENRSRAATSKKAIETAVAAIEKLGGEVRSAYRKRRPRTWLEEQFNDPGGSDDPTGVLEVTSVSFSSITDADLRHLEGLTNLQSLSLRATRTTDAGLNHLKGLTQLKSLSLWGTNVADAGLEHLSALTDLQSLNLSFTGVTDAGLEHLKEMSELQDLYLSGTQVTDAGLTRLSGLKHLQFLNLSFTKVTNEGVKKLQQALPNCEISYIKRR